MTKVAINGTCAIDYFEDSIFLHNIPTISYHQCDNVSIYLHIAIALIRQPN